MNRKRIMAGMGIPVLVMSLFFFAFDIWGLLTITGRMTGGGSIFLDGNPQTGDPDLVDGFPAPDGTRITHSFQLHCALTDEQGNPIINPPNNLQVNVHLPDGLDHRFHLEELTSGECLRDESNLERPAPPKNSENYWYDGAGTGRYDGVAGFCADWIFTDEGEPGTDDRIVSLRIWTGPDCVNGTGATFVLSIFGPGHVLTFGNHQAHRATGSQ